MPCFICLMRVHQSFEGSFAGFHRAFQKKYRGRGTALQLVKMVTEQFTSFRDETLYKGQRSRCFLRQHLQSTTKRRPSISVETRSDFGRGSMGRVLSSKPF